MKAAILFVVLRRTEARNSEACPLLPRQIPVNLLINQLRRAR